MKILILGRNEVLYDTAVHLAQSGRHEIVGIVTAHAQPEYRRREPDFEALAARLGVPFLVSETLSPAVRALVAASGATIGVSMNWVSVVKADFLALLPDGILNAHFGDLPSYRGNAVTNWALLRGEPDVALTVHFMTPGELDAGDIVAQTRFALSDDVTIAQINAFAQREIPRLMQTAVDGLADGSLTPKPQATRGLPAFRCYPRLPGDGLIHWHDSAEQIHRQIRALTQPYSGAYTYYRDAQDRLRKLLVWQSRLESRHCPDVGVPGQIMGNHRTSGESWILTGQGVLALCLCAHADDASEPFAPGHVWKSIRARLGMAIEDEIYRLNTLSERV